MGTFFLNYAFNLFQTKQTKQTKYEDIHYQMIVLNNNGPKKVTLQDEKKNLTIDAKST